MKMFRVLLVDDDPDFLDSASSYIKKHNRNLDIEAVRSFEDALELVKEDGFDCIVSDYQMSGFNGLELLKKIRDGLGLDLPFILFSEKCREDVAVEALNLGADRYLQKGENLKTQLSDLSDYISQEGSSYITKKEKEKPQTQLQEIFDSIPFFVALISKNHEILLINQIGAKLLGECKEEIIGQKCYSLFHSQQGPIKECPVEEAIEENKSIWEKEFQENGKNYVSTANPITNQKGELKYVVHTIRDITEIKESEKKLKEKKETLEKREEKFREGIKKYRKLTEASPNSILLIEKGSGEIIEANRKSEVLFSKTRKELIGSKLLELVPDNERDEWKNFLERKEEKDRFTKHIKKDDGKLVPVELGRSKLRFRNKETIYLVLKDITQRKEIEEREEFLHSLLRHDVRNKNQVIEGYLRLLKEEDFSDKIREKINKSLRVAKESEKIIKKVEMLKEIDEEEISKIKIDESIEEAIDSLQSRAQEKNIEILTDIPNRTWVKGGKLIKEAFTNLIENSIKHSGGNKIKISCNETQREVICTYEDDGKGIPIEVEDQIFDKGFKCGETAGTGIGTYIIRKIIEGYGGSIKLKEPNLGGAKFKIKLQKP